MRTKPIRILFFLLTFLPGLFACKHEAEKPATVCRLTSVTDQLVESSGKLTNELQRTFLYLNDTLIGMKELSPNRNITFGTAQTNGRIVQVADGSATVIAFAYSAGGTAPPTSATFTQGGKVQSVFTMQYTTAGQLSQINERRQILPANSLVIERTYMFTYDNTGNLTNERVKFIFQGGGPVFEQVTEYTTGMNPSPYTHFSARSILTVTALSQVSETHPSRFWHQNAPTAYKTYDLNTDGSRSTLRESSTFAPTYDADNKLMTQDQTALLYQSSVPTPITKNNRQAFVYECK
ncbi:hypothetical protein ACFSUS_09555 [Spirosoma soli]|uniref:YD repeat-containing protein n=1 Tax=Spirosoma soli TaxID=1770529 RepID=A0ABW5M598_9BACT